MRCSRNASSSRKKTPRVFPDFGVREGACPIASWMTGKKTPRVFPDFGVWEGACPLASWMTGDD